MIDEWGLGVKTKTVEETIKEEVEQARLEKKAKDTNVFNIISSAVDRKIIPADEDYAKIPTYLFLKYFSNDPTGLVLINELNTRSNIPSKWEYWFMRIMMPKSIRFIRYNKKEKFDDPDLLENLMQYYKCNELQAKEYYSILPPAEVAKIKSIYKTGRIK
jgi:hypothetical protein